MLSNLLWASSLMGWGSFCFTAWVLKGFHVAIVARGKTTETPPKTTPTGNPTAVTDVAIEIPPVIATDVIKPVSTISVILMSRFSFFWHTVYVPQFH